MDLYTAEKLAKENLIKHGLKDLGWIFKFDNSVRRFGVCKHYRRIISLSKHLTRLNPVEDVLDTILHEIAHALVGPKHGHDAVWKAKCVEIGAKPIRCYSEDIVQPKLRYTAVCGACEKEFQRQRRPKTFNNPLRRESCNCQSGRPWDKRVLITWKENF